MLTGVLLIIIIIFASIGLGLLSYKLLQSDVEEELPEGYVAMEFDQLCIGLYTNEINCDYLYTEIPQEQLLVMWYSAHGKPTNFLYGFTYHSDQKIYLNQGYTMDDLMHEVKHIKCYLEFERTGENHPDCISKTKHYMYDPDGTRYQLEPTYPPEPKQ